MATKPPRWGRGAHSPHHAHHHKTRPDTATNRKEPDMATKETPTMAEALALLQTELGARPIGHDQLLTIG